MQAHALAKKAAKYNKEPRNFLNSHPFRRRNPAPGWLLLENGPRPASPDRQGATIILQGMGVPTGAG